ncbi:MAG TPA: GTPase Era [Longimicrobiales bacterium]
MAQPGRSEHPGAETRAGYVAVVGRPNVGKSTLLNRLVGERLSIVTPRAQTTRERVIGILSEAGVQIVFIDTPGLLEPRYLLQQSMLDAALSAVREADAVLLLLDATRPDERVPPGAAAEALHRRRDALFVAINKVDAGESAAVEELAGWVVREFGVTPYRISALEGRGTDALLAALAAALPPSPFLYPPDEIAVQPVRFFVAELIRETIFEEYREEVPYSTTVRVEEFREAERPVFIRATVFVERESQKAIIIGRKGAGIRTLGRRAREKVEAFLGTAVMLDLWVKVMPGWRKKRSALAHLGYAVATRERARGGGRRRGRNAARSGPTSGGAERRPARGREGGSRTERSGR